MEEALHDTPIFREFAGLDMGEENLPDESTTLRFRHLLEKKQLSLQLLTTVNPTLTAKGLMLKSGMVVDASLIAAPSSTRNTAQLRTLFALSNLWTVRPSGPQGRQKGANQPSNAPIRAPDLHAGDLYNGTDLYQCSGQWRHLPASQQREHRKPAKHGAGRRHTATRLSGRQHIHPHMRRRSHGIMTWFLRQPLLKARIGRAACAWDQF